MSEKTHNNIGFFKKLPGILSVLFLIILSVLTIFYFKTRDTMPFKYKYAPELFLARFYLADDASKKVYDSAIPFYSDYESDTPHVFSYFFEPAHKYVFVHKGDYIIDGGVSSDTSISEYYLQKTGDEGKVFGIEANTKIMDIINKNLEQYPNFKLYNYALWSENGKGEFGLGENPDDANLDARLIASKEDEFKAQNTIKVNLITLDDLIKNENIEKVDYIKYDIEGAELPALSASVNTIKKYKPDLVLSCHHDYDFFKIILFIHSMDCKYKIYMVEHPDYDKYWRNYMIYATVRNADNKEENIEENAG